MVRIRIFLLLWAEAAESFFRLLGISHEQRQSPAIHDSQEKCCLSQHYSLKLAKMQPVVLFEENDIPALLKQIAVLEAQVKHLEAERFLSFGQFAAAVVPLQRAIVLGHTPSRALLAWLFLHAREGIVINRQAALELVEEGARLACHHCQGVLAYCLWTEPPRDGEIIIVEEPPPRVRQMALASSIRGSAYGQFVLGILEMDENAALVFLRLAAEQHLDAAQFEVGKAMHEGGYCLPSQHAEALRWFQLAATQGYPRALFSVGLMHELGHGMLADNAAAIHWYKRAAAAGHPRASCCLQKFGVHA
jgi:TPR repeat protein